MGSSGVENRSPSFSVTLEASEPYVSFCVTFVIVEPIHAELLRVFGLVRPQKLDIARGAAIVLAVSQSQDIIDL